MSNYRITVIKSFGNFKTLDSANAAKKAIKAKVKKAIISAPVKTIRGYKFSTKLTYIRNVNAPASAVKRAVQRMAQGSKVTVTKL